MRKILTRIVAEIISCVICYLERVLNASGGEVSEKILIPWVNNLKINLFLLAGGGGDSSV
jgi:hypothetical protein